MSPFSWNGPNWFLFLSPSLMSFSLTSGKPSCFSVLSSSAGGPGWDGHSHGSPHIPNLSTPAQQAHRPHQQHPSASPSSTEAPSNSSLGWLLHHSFNLVPLITAASGSDAQKYKALSFLPHLPPFFFAFHQILPPLCSLLISLSCL